jgi:hypothetical protein
MFALTEGVETGSEFSGQGCQAEEGDGGWGGYCGETEEPDTPGYADGDHRRDEQPEEQHWGGVEPTG